MENASKALLIAGAILLVIAIIAIAVGIVTKTRSTVGVAETQIDAMEVKMHNNQFTMYEGTITGAEVKECIAKVLSNNDSTKNRDMNVYVEVKKVINNAGSTSVVGKYGRNYTSTGAISASASGYNTFSSSTVNSNDRYTCITSINSLGIEHKR